MGDCVRDEPPTTTERTTTERATTTTERPRRTRPPRRRYRTRPTRTTTPVPARVVRTDCGTSDDPNGYNYRGNKRTTWLNADCQDWNSFQPNDHRSIKPELQHVIGTYKGNYCRNPDNDLGGPWCYLKYRKTWQYCFETWKLC